MDLSEVKKLEKQVESKLKRRAELRECAKYLRMPDPVGMDQGRGNMFFCELGTHRLVGYCALGKVAWFAAEARDEESARQWLDNHVSAWMRNQIIEYNDEQKLTFPQIASVLEETAARLI